MFYANLGEIPQMLFDVNAYIATYFCNSLGSSCGTFVRVVASNTGDSKFKLNQLQKDTIDFFV